MNQTKVIPNIEVEDIDHLGIIAGIIDDIGIVDIINKRVGEHTQEQVSAGHVVKALILNCMGFLSAPLYLFHQFFVGKGTEHLLGEGIKAEYLNARRIGRVLDKLTSRASQRFS
jgi:transposase